MGEPCAHPGNDGLSAAGTVTWHRCNSDQRPLPTTSDVGIAVNPMSSTVYKGGSSVQGGAGAADAPFEHKSIPFREDVAFPPKRELTTIDQYSTTGYDTSKLNRHEQTGLALKPEVNKTECGFLASTKRNRKQMNPSDAVSKVRFERVASAPPAPRDTSRMYGGEMYQDQPLGAIQEFPKAGVPCDAFIEGRVEPYPNGYGCSSDVKRSLDTTIPYAADIKEKVKQTKTILRLMDSENDPLPFPNMLGKGQTCCDKHPTNVVMDATANVPKTPNTRLRELNRQLRTKVNAMQCMGTEHRRDLGTSIPYVADQVTYRSNSTASTPGGCHGAVSMGGSNFISPTQMVSMQTMSLPQAITIADIDEPVVSLGGGGGTTFQAYDFAGPTFKPVRSHPPGSTIPYRADVEPPPVYTRPPPSDPHVITDQIETLNVEVKSDTNHKPQPLTLMSPERGEMPSMAFDSRPGGAHFVVPQSGEMILTRTPRSTTWQEAYQQLKHLNRQGNRPLSADSE
ncbi:uncharacterized protein LOC142342387 isoform X2 [Convolutriloba macropyga]|uniref:uncharacterized protein LOC142342387 isoform X2 n=1 Tax=Convolutriloba macropyga TaxID=536237 RepID=UPI003F51EE78